MPTVVNYHRYATASLANHFRSDGKYRYTSEQKFGHNYFPGEIIYMIQY